ncbi:MAG TPA: EF-hand domain-containing protein [Gemmataceae bacterium]|nr:EF-hand domain-containing protein [Gemmataceae bacterium]
MRRKWITVPAFLVGLLALTTVDSQGQPPGGFGGRERGGFGRGGSGGPDPEMIWNFMARGQDSINLNDPQHARTRQRMAERGEPIPPNGILSKQQFVAGMQQRMAQGGGMGGPGGGPGRFTPPGGGFTPPGGSPNVMTFQATPGPDGRPVVMMPGGSPGMPGGPPGMSGNPDEMMQNIFRMSDRNQDGRLDRDEVRGGLRDRFEQHDTNRDGAIDFNEYRPYMQERMAGRGGDSRGPGGSSSDPRNGSMSPSFPGSPGGPPGGWGGPPGGDNRSRNSQEEEERPTVVRYGKLPKGMPSWFEEYDTDQDGQVGLYEWRRKSRPTAEFVEMDLNTDGYLTAGEWLRHQALAIERRASDSESGSVGFGGPGSSGGMRFQPGGAGGDRTRGQPNGGSAGERFGKDRPTGKDRANGKDRSNGGDQGNGDRPRKGSRNPFTGN